MGNGFIADRNGINSNNKLKLSSKSKEKEYE
jgi:hypothetical protein